MPRKSCCVKSCNKTRADNTILHKFPNPKIDLHRFNEWTRAIGGDVLILDANIVHNRYTVCHSHFEVKYQTYTRRLSAIAVPTLNLSDNTDPSSEHIYSKKKHYDHSYHKLKEGQEATTSAQENVNPQTNHSYSPRRHLDHTYCQLEPQKGIPSSSNEVKEEEINKDGDADIVQTAMMQADLPIDPEDPLMVKQNEQENDMDIDQDDDDDDEVLVTQLYTAFVAPLPPTKYNSSRSGVLASVEPTEAPSTDSEPPDEVTDADTVKASEAVAPQGHAEVAFRDQYKKLYSSGPCRCCLKEGLHRVVDVRDALECLNMRVCVDPRVSQRVCAECAARLRQARQLRDSAAAAQRTLRARLGLHADVIFPLAVEQPEEELGKIREEADTAEDGELEAPDDGAARVEAPDDGTRLGASSQLSAYSDFPMDTKDNDEQFGVQEVHEIFRAMREERTNLSAYIRENLITILDNSTVLPFASRRGDKLECIYCDASYPRADLLRTHVDDTHASEQTSFKLEILKTLPQSILRADVSCIKCTLCYERFDTIDNLVQHLVKIHEKVYHSLTLDPPHNILRFNLTLDVWKCLECDRTFNKFSKLKLHVNEHYGNILCHECGSKFLFHKQYSAHLVDHRRSKPRRVCDVCGEFFRLRKELLYHQNRKHYVPKPKKETYLSLDQSLITKQRSEHRESSGAVLKCRLCNIGPFTDLYAAYMHRIGHLNNTREAPFKCDMCKYSNAIKKNLKNHLRGHYSIKDHECGICKKRFSQKGQLSIHLNVHLNVRFQCPLCHTTLANKNLVKRHVKKQHPDVNVEFSI